MRTQRHFKSGRHLRAARAMAGLSQQALADLAGLHPNSLKRLERMPVIKDSWYSCGKLDAALRSCGVLTSFQPVGVSLIDGWAHSY